jgi:plastocyanin
MRVSAAQLILALAAATLIAGCNDRSDSKSNSSKPRAAGPSAAGGIGSVHGTVSLRGEPPAMREIDNHSCHPGATPLREETVVAGENGKLANVVVFLREAPMSSGAAATPVELDQVNCRYVPHVMALQTNQVLRVKTSDPAVHNVHVTSKANPARNVSMEAGAPPVELTFAKPEDFAVRCDIHPWMNAQVHVFEHNAFAVTGMDGSFSLNNVPAGQYTLVFRHELFGDIEETIELADKATLVKDATYEKPQ